MAWRNVGENGVAASGRMNLSWRRELHVVGESVMRRLIPRAKARGPVEATSHAERANLTMRTFCGQLPAAPLKPEGGRGVCGTGGRIPRAIARGPALICAHPPHPRFSNSPFLIFPFPA